jgi:hypothetical protein
MLKALHIDTEGCKRLFTTFPEAKNHPGIVELVENYGRGG